MAIRLGPHPGFHGPRSPYNRLERLETKMQKALTRCNKALFWNGLWALVITLSGTVGFVVALSKLVNDNYRYMVWFPALIMVVIGIKKWFGKPKAVKEYLTIKADFEQEFRAQEEMMKAMKEWQNNPQPIQVMHIEAPPPEPQFTLPMFNLRPD